MLTAVLGHAQAENRPDHQEGHRNGYGRPGSGSAHAEQLDPKLAKTAAVEQPRSRDLVGTESG